MSNLLHTEPIPQHIPGARTVNDGLSPFQRHGTQYLNQGAALFDQIATKLNEVITMIDEDRFNGHEDGLLVHTKPQVHWGGDDDQQERSRGGRSKSKTRTKGKLITSNPSATSMNYFAKVNLYANSRLPPNLPPLKLYVNLSGRFGDVANLVQIHADLSSSLPRCAILRTCV